MAVVTLELPDELVARLRERAAEDGIELNDSAIAALWEYAEDAESIDPEADAALIAAGNVAIEDMAAGRLYTLEQAENHARAALEARKSERQMRAAA